MLNALTIDVEGYYRVPAFESSGRFEDGGNYDGRVECNTQRMLDILAATDIHATFFMLGYVAERHPSIVKAIHAAGHEIASHGYAHRLVYNMTPEGFRQDLRKAKHLLEDLTGSPVLGYRAASHSITKQSFWSLDILVEEGFEYDSSIFPIRHDRYGISGYPRFPHRVSVNGRSLIEYPLSTVRIGGVVMPIAGGKYLRLLPYGVTRWALLHINENEQQPAMIYLHPWEIDPDQPESLTSKLTRWRRQVNLNTTEGKFRCLLRDFRFGPVRDVIGLLDLCGDRAENHNGHSYS